MDLAATWDAEAYSSNLSEFDVFRFSETAGPSFEEPEVIIIEDDDKIEAPIVIADDAGEVNSETEPWQAQAPPATLGSDATPSREGAQSINNSQTPQSPQQGHSATANETTPGTSAPVTQASDIQDPPTNPRLLSLPPEVRNIIWGYTVTKDRNVIHLSIREYHDDEIATRLNITLTNHQIRHESLLMFYASNTFLLRAKPYPSKTPLTNLSKWLGHLKEEYRAMLGRVVVCAKTSTEASVKFDWGREDERFGFEVQGTVAIGGGEGHHCNDQHYLLARESGEEAAEEDAGEDGGEGEGEAADQG